MVPKPEKIAQSQVACFRAVLFRMVPKPPAAVVLNVCRFRAVLFRMVPKQRQMGKD